MDLTWKSLLLILMLTLTLYPYFVGMFFIRKLESLGILWHKIKENPISLQYGKKCNYAR